MKPSICIYGVPYDNGINRRKGAKAGPSAVRKHFSSMGDIFFETHAKVPDILKDLDQGDILNLNDNTEQSFKLISNVTTNCLKKFNAPIFIGGDHSITIPILKSMTQFYGHRLGVIHIDAHSDTYPAIGGNRFHHGSTFRTLIEDGDLSPNRLYQFGLRGIKSSKSLFDDLGHEKNQISFDTWKKADFDVVTFLPSNVPFWYLSLDIDVVDPAFAPGTGSPVPGGLSSNEILSVVKKLSKIKLIGSDIVECSPNYDVGGTTSLLVCYLICSLVAHCEFVHPE